MEFHGRLAIEAVPGYPSRKGRRRGFNRLEGPAPQMELSAWGLMLPRGSVMEAWIGSEYVVYGAGLGLLLGVVFAVLFLYRRIRWVVAKAARKGTAPIGVLASLRSLVFLLTWFALSGMLLFAGFFLQAYHAFNLERPVAEIVAHPLEAPGKNRGAVVQVSTLDSPAARFLIIRGDQWMIEGDILKWDPLLNFLGLHTRYRLTRLRGRYLRTQDERNRPHTIHSLTPREENPLWRILYLFGPKMPFVSSVYGNAAFQASDRLQRYRVYVGTSGFVVREVERHPS